MKQGFSLLEVLIATAISSLLTTAMFFSYNQINKVVRHVTDATDLYEAAILVEQQISKDISGAFIPVQAIEPKKPKKSAEDKKDSQKKDDKKKDTKPQPAQQGEQKKEAKKVPVLKDAFVSKNAGKNFSMFSFITANPMRVYWGKKTGAPKPSIARVVYTLEADKDADKKNPRYQLYRQEGIELELAPYTKRESSIERYAIADNITACKLTFIVADDSAEAETESKGGEKKSDAPKQAKPKDIEIKTFNDWTIGKEKKDVRTRLMIPDEVLMEVTIADEFGKREQTFKFPVRIAAGLQEPPEIPLRQAQSDKGGKKNDKDQKGTQQGQKKQPQAKKEILVTGANSVVQNLRAMFRT